MTLMTLMVRFVKWPNGFAFRVEDTEKYVPIWIFGMLWSAEVCVPATYFSLWHSWSCNLHALSLRKDALSLWMPHGHRKSERLPLSHLWWLFSLSGPYHLFCGTVCEVSPSLTEQAHRFLDTLVIQFLLLPFLYTAKNTGWIFCAFVSHEEFPQTLE